MRRFLTGRFAFVLFVAFGGPACTAGGGGGRASAGAGGTTTPSGAAGAHGYGDGGDSAGSAAGMGGAAGEPSADAGGAGAPDAVGEPAPEAGTDSRGEAGAGTDAAGGAVTHRLLSSVSDKGILAIVAADGHIEWQYDVLPLGGEANDAWLLANGDVAFAYVKGAQELTPAKNVVWKYAAPAGSEVHTCQPLPNGNFLIGEAHDGGVGYLRELDGTGKVQSSVTINVGGGLAPHSQWREVRKTPQGTYLVTYLQLNKAMEFDASGNKLREFACGQFVAIRLPGGNTLVSCGDDHRVIEVDPQDKIVWQVGENEIPGNTLGFAAGLQRLPNGNTIICNWPGHTGLATPPPQAFELTPDKKVVWQLNAAPLGWVSNVEILDPDAQVGGVVLR
ncbi:MAG TPA: hypothetical protein VG319_09745 [Polyangia bacterium]|jgi:hypothetical protein|nr:hypothetical protein [Polyangia bacterium]